MVAIMVPAACCHLLNGELHEEEKHHSKQLPVICQMIKVAKNPQNNY